ncbi:MAG: hypothetical protein AAFQ60_09445, partial [Pseudomonadota bacterium]
LFFYTRYDPPRSVVYAREFLHRKFEIEGHLYFSNIDVAEMFMSKKRNLEAGSKVLHMVFFAMLGFAGLRYLRFGLSFDYTAVPNAALLDALVFIQMVFAIGFYYLLQSSVRRTLEVFRGYTRDFDLRE